MAAFDGRLFDGGTFDIGQPDIVKTLGGWAAQARTQPTWAPNDLTRGTQWNSKAKGQSTW